MLSEMLISGVQFVAPRIEIMRTDGRVKVRGRPKDVKNLHPTTITIMTCIIMFMNMIVVLMICTITTKYY